MTVFRDLTEIPANFGPAVLTIGNFDGVHRGHAEIMRRVAAIGRERGWRSVVLTFDPHPARVLAPERAPKMLMTLEQRLGGIAALGIDAALVLPFSADFAKLSPGEFASQIVAGVLGAKTVLVGEDFRFGYKQAGNVVTLRELGDALGFEIDPVPAVPFRGERVSSSAIRRHVEQGKVSRACRMAGHPFALIGDVVPGEGRGSRQTVPTLNLAPENEVLPAVGVYVTRVREAGRERVWPSITNVGFRPTFHGRSLTVETFLLSPLNGETPVRITVEFLKYLREERQFADAVALKSQILKDVVIANRMHGRLAALGVG